MSHFPHFIYTKGIAAVQEGLEMTPRQRVLAIVKNVTKNLYLVIVYTSNEEVAFVSGGVDPGKDAEATIKDELRQEAGITQIDNIKKMTGREYHIDFYSPHRQKNFQCFTEVFRVETNDPGEEVSMDEKNIQKPYRRTLAQIRQYISAGEESTDYDQMHYLLQKIEENHETRA